MPNDKPLKLALTPPLRPYPKPPKKAWVAAPPKPPKK